MFAVQRAPARALAKSARGDRCATTRARDDATRDATTRDATIERRGQKRRATGTATARDDARRARRGDGSDDED